MFGLTVAVVTAWWLLIGMARHAWQTRHHPIGWCPLCHGDLPCQECGLE